MKRIATLGALVLSFLLLQAGGPGFAQQAAQKQGAQKQAAPPCPKALPEDVHVQKVWETAKGPKEPEIAVLQFSGDEYKEFNRDQKQYLNDHCIFPVPVRRAVSTVDLSEDEVHKKKAEAKKDDPCVAVVVHTKYSTFATISSCRDRP